MTNDIIYLSSDKSTWDNEELRYSLRSVEKHFPSRYQSEDLGHNQGRVFLYGYKPPFINDSMPFIEVSDPYLNKSKNITEKIKKACENDDLTDNILIVADDTFFNDDVKWEWFNLPFYHGTLNESIERAGNYKYYLEETKRALDRMLGAWAHGSYKNFDCHIPILINRYKFLEMMKKVYFDPDGSGPIVKTMYTYYCRPTIEVPGKPIYYNPKVTMDNLHHDQYGALPIFSTGEEFRGDIAHAIMEAKYPKKSKWEV